MGCPLGYVDQDHKARRAFDESAYRRTISGTHEAVTLPMPDLYPVGCFGGSISDHRHASADFRVVGSGQPLESGTSD